MSLVSRAGFAKDSFYTAPNNYLGDTPFADVVSACSVQQR
jgi:hypothetical protein